MPESANQTLKAAPEPKSADATSLTVRNLSVLFGKNAAVTDLSLRVPKGSVYGFIGPNGAGKSTTMRMILGLDAPTGGSVTVNGSPLPTGK